ncbi:MAG: excinuclease ABC subunit UvrA [Hyphomicrobiales bacterium]
MNQNEDKLVIIGAREHNLKDINIDIPRDKLVVITGLSGSGKSSLAFDTIYSEGQRRYMETFSAYARQFIGNLERPDVDHISGLSPVISIEQKSVSKNPRSTVGTTTEIYDFIRLLFARVADAYSYKSGKKMIKYTDRQLSELILKEYKGKRIYILAPLIKGRKGHYRELFTQIQKQGYIKVRVDGKIQEIEYGMQLDRYKVHDIEAVIDQLIPSDSEKDLNRLLKTLETAFKLGKGLILVQEYGTENNRFFSKKLMCPETGLAYDEPEPNTFSFNSPYGACPKCNGLGTVAEIDLLKIFPDPSLSIRKGGIAPLGEYKKSWIFKQMEAIGYRYDFTLDTPINDISKEAKTTILYGTKQPFEVKKEFQGIINTYSVSFSGIMNFIKEQSVDNNSKGIKRWAESFMNHIPCNQCKGDRLKKTSLWFKIDDKNISDLANMDLIELYDWMNNIKSVLNERQYKIAYEIVREIKDRLSFLLDVGIDYLTLNRPAKSLSGGESQRIRLATQIGSQLTGVMYILDEPSIGLHQRDNDRLIESMHKLRDIGNSLIVVEHDKDTILAADYVLDIGPEAGIKGGHVVAAGTPEELKLQNSITSQYLNGTKEISIPEKRRDGNGLFIEIKGASGNNLRNVNFKLPLGKLICVTGVSGSGKSTLINETLYPILSQHFYRSVKNPMKYKSIDGIENIDKVIDIDQNPIGRTPRSNPATYTKVFDEIRKLFGNMPESKIRGYKSGRFSFNVKGGRCEECKGAGIKVIEMNFLPDVNVPCEVCHGKRYNRETLEIRYKGRSINDVLNMTINQAVEFFENIPYIIRKIKTLQDVGLGYLTLGQPSTTISGGEAQRVKLATELSKKDTGKTLYILDEPTTGLHFEDVKVLLDVLNKLVDKGNSVLVIEHNMEVIKIADYIVDMGPEGGKRGGNIIVQGTPEEIINNEKSHTAVYLRKEL